MQRVETTAALRALLKQWRQSGDRIAFVPTMGDLHAGHLALVKEARQHAERVVVSIFVNPLQFGENEDFDHYPRLLERDSEKLKAVGVDLLFSPPVAEVYPNGLQGVVRVDVPTISSILCGASRPGHFSGVATVVSKLLNMVQPDCAVFGEKDFQQLLVIKKLVSDLCFSSEIIGVPTCREIDGLAMSSRNRYLTDSQRQQAPMLNQALQKAKKAVTGASLVDFQKIAEQATISLNKSGFKVDYFEVRRAADLAKPMRDNDEFVILVAAWLGSARLIDNVRVPIPR